MTIFSMIRVLAAAALVGCALALAGCFMTPGKFSSELALTGPDSFTFRYEGEIFLLGLSKLAMMDATSETAFTANCFDDETYESRDCTPEEVASQREEWEAGAAARAENAKQKAQQMAALMGGIDPSDPKASEELVKLLQRQKGWDRVVHKGDGVFDVSYRVSGTLGHDFMFPMIEGFPATNPFVQLIQRKGGQVRITAPGFSGEAGGMDLMMGLGSRTGLTAMGVAVEAREAGTNGEAVPGIPVIDGTFTVRAAPGMRILANNTDEGPAAATDGGEVLTWQISPRTAQAPTALIAAAH